MSIFRVARTYFYLIRIQFKILKEYPINLLFGILATILWHLPGFFLLTIAVKNTPLLNEWSYENLLLLYGLSVFGDGVQHFLFEGSWSFGSKYIRNGEFDRLLIRPTPELLQVAGSRIDIDGIGGIVLGLSVTIYSLYLGQIDWNVYAIVFLLIALSCSILIYFTFNLFTASLAFWVVDNMPITFGFFQFHILNKFPVEYYPKIIRVMITWIIPTSFATYYPALPMLQKNNAMLLGYLALPVSFLFLMAAYMMWKLGIRRYQGTGS